MPQNNRSRTFGILASVILLIGTLVGFFWFWNSAQPAVVIDVAIDQKYQKIEIAGLVSDAEALIANKQNAGDLPVLTPTADKMSRDNPFAGL
ncbi:MAG TPA: hypothetical protein VJK08_03035 [Patescibacteria group bacterium]|nr:hypothetical protein [Patescibacteria group bacterium]